jgi:hypothetical protein
MIEVIPPINTPDKLFHDGNPATGALGTIVSAEWLNNIQNGVINIQQEIATILENSEIVPDNSANQLFIALKLLMINNSYPVGAPIPWSSNIIPDGYALAQGQSFDPDLYPLLAKAYPSHVLPDLRGQVIKGRVDSREILSHETDNNKSHTHDAYAHGADLGTKATEAFDYGWKETNANGNHNHSFAVGGVGGSNYPVMSNGNGSWNSTTWDGEHSHSIHIGAHAHYINLGAHSHDIDIGYDGASEVTVKNIAFNYIVRLA